MNTQKKVEMISIIKWMGFGIALSVAIVGCKQSYEEKMAEFQKQADAYKDSIGSNFMILGEYIDSTALKIYYYDSVNYELKEYNIITGVEKDVSEFNNIYPEVKEYGQSISELTIKNSRAYGERLFLLIKSVYHHNHEIVDFDITLYYINMRDNSFHSLTSYVNFEGGDGLSVDFIEDGVVVKERYDYNLYFVERQYILPTNISDNEYDSITKNNFDIGVESAKKKYIESEFGNYEKYIEWLQEDEVVVVYEAP